VLRGSGALRLPEDAPAEVDKWTKLLGTLIFNGENRFYDMLGSMMVIGMGFLLLAGTYVTRPPVAPAAVAYTMHEAVGVNPHR
jgi:hypothetical protein